MVVGFTTAYMTTDVVSLFVCLMVFNATFNNISVISWWSVLLLEETGVPVENHRLMRSSTPHHGGIRTHNFCGDRH
jgi:hypothetical protein